MANRTSKIGTLACGLLLGAVLTIPREASVQADESEALSPRLIGDLGGETTAVVVGPAAAYAAVGARIQVLSRGSKPAPMGSSPLLAGRVHDLALEGETLYVAAGPAGLLAFDVAQPERFELLGQLPPPEAGARVVDLEILSVGRVAAILEEAGGSLSSLHVVETRAPDSMSVLAEVALGERVNGMERLGSRLVLSTPTAGLRLIDFDAATTELRVLGQLEGRYGDVAVAGDRLFAIHDTYFQEIEWSTPEAPRVLYRNLESPEQPQALWGAPGRVCAASVDYGLWCFELEVGEEAGGTLGYELGPSRRLHRASDFRGAASMALDGTAVYLAAGADGLHRVELKPGKAEPRKISHFVARSQDLAFRDDLAFSASYWDGLDIWDMSRQDDAQQLWHGDVFSTELELDGDRLYTLFTVNDGTKIEIRDMSEPKAPSLIGSLTLPDVLTHELQVETELVYVVKEVRDLQSRSRSLLIVDATDPAAPQVLGQFPLRPFANWLECHEGYCWYLSHSPWELVAIDVRDPANPKEVAASPVPERSRQLRVEEDRLAFLTTEQLLVYELEPAGQARQIGAPIPTVGPADVAIDGHVLVMSSYDGLRFFDVSDPDRVVETRSWDPAGAGGRGSAADLRLDGQGMLVSMGSGTERIVIAFDLSGMVPGLAERVLAAAWDAPTDLFSAGGRSYLASGWSGDWIIDTRDRARPALLGQIKDRIGRPTGDHPPKPWRLNASSEGLLVVSPFTAYDVSEPARPVERYRYEVEQSQVTGYTPATWPPLIDGSLGFMAWVSGNRSGRVGPVMLDLVDLAGPTVPFRVGRLELGDDPEDMVRTRGHLYVAGRGGLKVVDTREPQDPVLVASLPGQYRALDARRGRMWALSADLLEVFDIGAPASPRKLASFTLPTHLPEAYKGRLAVAHVGLRTYGAIPLGEGGLLLLDLSEDLPRTLGLWQPGWSVAAVSLEGRHATVALERGGLLTLDLDLEGGPIVDRLYLPAVSR